MRTAIAVGTALLLLWFGAAVGTFATINRLSKGPLS